MRITNYKRVALCSLFAVALIACDNGEAQRMQAEAEKAKMEAELAKAKAEVEIAKAQAEANKVRAEAGARADVHAREAETGQAARSPSNVGQGSTNQPSTTAPDSSLSALGRETKAVLEKNTDAPADKSVEVSPTIIVNVRERKADGNSWDTMGGAPDVRVTMTTPGGSFQSPVAQDRYSASFKMPKMKLTPGDTVSIVVVDVDAMQHDPIGNASVTFRGPGTSAAISGGSMSGSIQF